MLSKKLQRIEDKLQPFRDQQTIKEKSAMEAKRKAEEREREWLLQLKTYEIEKIKHAHQYQIEQDKRIYQFWASTEKVKHERIAKDTKFVQQMNQRIKDQVVRSRAEEARNMQESIQYFIQTCIRQGIELKHDSEKPKVTTEKAEFSAVATMMKIRDRTRKNEEAHKARQKRRNKMLVEQQRQQAEAEAKKREEQLLERFQRECLISNQGASRVWITGLRTQLQVTERAIKEVEVRDEQMKLFDEMQKVSRVREMEQMPLRRQAWRENQLQYMEINLEKKIRKRAKHELQLESMMLSLLDLTETCFQQQQQTGSVQLDFKFWREMMDKWQNTFIEPIPQQPDVLANMSMYDVGQSQDFFQYYCGGGEWRPTHFYLNEDKSIFNRPFINQELGEFLYDVVDTLHPKAPIKVQPPEIPTHLPLRLSIIGAKFSGRRTLANYLQQRFGIQLIAPELIIKEALLEAFPPVEDEKTLKNRKKDPKKVEEERKENPQLKALGIRIREFQDTGEPISDELMVAIVLYKLTSLFQPLTPEQIEAEILEAKSQEQAKIEQQQQQDTIVQPVKKAAPPPKKGAKVIEVIQQEGPSKEELIKQYLNAPKAHFYTKGYAIIGFPSTISQARLFQEALTGYVPEEERLNEEAELLKKKIVEMAAPQTPPPSNFLLTSGIDMIIYLNTPLEERVRRQQQRRIDPQSEIIYNLEENPPPTDVKGLVERLQTIQDVAEGKDALAENQKLVEGSVGGLQEWCSQFGFTEPDGPESFTHFQQFQMVDVGKEKGFEVAMKVDSSINRILEIKRTRVTAVGVEEQPNPYSQFDKPICEVLLKQWLTSQHTYSKDVASQLKKAQQHRRKVVGRVTDLQRQLLDILHQPDEKVTKLVAFQESYNKFLDENPDLSKQKNAKGELHKHLDILYENMWDILDKKKIEATTFLTQVVKNPDWVEQEMNLIIQGLLMLLQNEANILGEITEIIANAKVMLKGVQVPDLGEHFILEPFESQENVPAWHDNTSPQVDQMFTYFIKELDNITRKVQENKDKFYLKRQVQLSARSTELLDEKISQILLTQKYIAIYRAHALRNIAISRIREIQCFKSLIQNRIDDWIIFGLKRENDHVYEVINQFRKCIDDRLQAVYQRNAPKEIVESYHMVLQQYSVYKPLLPSFEIPQNGRFLLHDWYQWSEELRSIADERSQISIKIFDQYFNRRINGKQVEANIPTCLQGLTGSFLNKKFPSGPLAFQLQPLLLSTLLLSSKLPTSPLIAQYIEDLKEAEGDHIEEFCEVPAWYDETETSVVVVDQESEMQIDRLFFVKRFLFDSVRTVDQVLRQK